MKPILLHIHIYYPNLWNEIKQCIQNIYPYPFDLFITMVKPHKAVINDIKLSFPSGNLRIVENRGYDVAPFVEIINNVDLNNYSYIIKLHTKRDTDPNTLINHFDLSGSRWRNYAFDIVSSSKNVQKCIKAFKTDPQLGMITNYRLIIEKDRADLISIERAKELLAKANLPQKTLSFAAGTMFMTRANLLYPLKELHLKSEDFEVSKPNCHSSTLAHAIERFLGYIITAQNKKISDVLTKFQYSHGIFRFLRQTIRKLKTNFSNTQNETK